MRLHVPRRSILVWLGASCAFITACADGTDPVAPTLDPAGYTIVPDLLDAFTRALAERDLEAYVELLHEDFTYCPQPADVEDFEWLGGRECWNLDEEIDMVSNMFDPNFVGPLGGQSVRSIEAALGIDVVTSVTEGELLALCHASTTVLWSGDTGLRSDMRVEFSILAAGDGVLKIRSIREWRRATGRSDDLPPLPQPPPPTWASIKALFRSGPSSP